MLDLECPITLEAYSHAPDYQPRILPCGHTISAAAVQLLLQLPLDRQVCPTDRKPLGCCTLDSFPVNYAVLGIVQRSEAELAAAVEAVFREREAERNAGHAAPAEVRSVAFLPPLCWRMSGGVCAELFPRAERHGHCSIDVTVLTRVCRARGASLRCWYGVQVWCTGKTAHVQCPTAAAPVVLPCAAPLSTLVRQDARRQVSATADPS